MRPERRAEKFRENQRRRAMEPRYKTQEKLLLPEVTHRRTSVDSSVDSCIGSLSHEEVLVLISLIRVRSKEPYIVIRDETTETTQDIQNS